MYYFTIPILSVREESFSTFSTGLPFNIWNQIYLKETFVSEIRAQKFYLLDLFDNICGKDFSGKEETICGVFQK